MGKRRDVPEVKEVCILSTNEVTDMAAREEGKEGPEDGESVDSEEDFYEEVTKADAVFMLSDGIELTDSEAEHETEMTAEEFAVEVTKAELH